MPAALAAVARCCAVLCCAACSAGKDSSAWWVQACLASMWQQTLAWGPAWELAFALGQHWLTSNPPPHPCLPCSAKLKLDRLRRRGKAPPKKGAGKRAGKMR